MIYMEKVAYSLEEFEASPQARSTHTPRITPGISKNELFLSREIIEVKVNNKAPARSTTA